MKNIIISILLTAVILAACTGCSKDPSDSITVNPPAATQSATQDQPTSDVTPVTEHAASASNPASGDDLFAISKVSGTVLDFTDTGCTLTPTVTDGDIAYQAAPGYEDQVDSTSISYSDGCTFQIAYINSQTGAVTYEDASVENVKKQSNLIVCGDYDSNGVLNADRIFIYRYTG